MCFYLKLLAHYMAGVGIGQTWNVWVVFPPRLTTVQSELNDNTDLAQIKIMFDTVGIFFIGDVYFPESPVLHPSN